MNKPLRPQIIETDQLRKIGQTSIISALAKAKTVEEANAILKGANK
jgi:hypothetical protein